MDIFNREDRAYLRLRFNYEASGLSTWGVSNPEANAPYRVGVTLDWPNKSDDVVDRQVARVRKIAESLGKAYDLEACVDGPIWAIGGAKAMYVGFIAKTASSLV